MHSLPQNTLQTPSPALPMQRLIAAPSWVTTGTIAENAAFILAKNEEAKQSEHTQSFSYPQQEQASLPTITEIGLCFFETTSCLAYTSTDLPPHLADLPFSWHIHLPSDLPWHEGGAAVARIALKLMDKVAFLGAKKAVLHPPLETNDTTLLRDFMAHWQASGRAPHNIHMENIHGHDLVRLWDTIVELGCKVCLDTGHLITYKQNALLALLLGQNEQRKQDGLLSTYAHNKQNTHSTNPLQTIGMLHLCATVPSGRHAPLTQFSADEQDLVSVLCRGVPSDCTFMLELFKWEHITTSWPLVRTWLRA